MVVAEWYTDRSVMVTGGMGFMGKVLLEKLLYSCSDLKAIYVLARAKRGVSPAARLEEITKLPLFERIRKEKPDVLKKLIAVESDITVIGLGIQDDDLRQRLLEEVSVVFHLAASLRLEAGLKAAVLNNTLSTKYVLDFCLEMRNLQVFLHLSTAFCHCDYAELEEKMYPPPAKPHDVIHLVQWLDDKSIDLITPRLLGPHPNSYTYSKRLAEYLVYEYKDKLPVCIARPSIVLPSYKEPMPGWVDTLNGPVGVLVGGGKGVIHSMLCGKNYAAEAVPVDIAINVLICIAQRLAHERSQPKEDTKDMPIYNLSSGAVCRISWDEILRKGKEIIHDYPFDYGIWYPNGKMRTNQFIHWWCVLFFHIIPAYFLDALLFITRNKRFMVRLQKRISTGLEVLQHFTTRDWYFHNEKALEAYNSLSKEDKEVFPVPQSDIDIDTYMKNAILGARVYCMKEPLSSLPRARQHLKLLYCIDCLMKMLFYGFLIWLIWRQLESIKFILDYPADALHGFPLFDTFLKLYK